MNEIKKKMLWDKEYATSWVREVKYLKEHGIGYQWVKTVGAEDGDRGISQWKYTKTKELFLTLANLYAEIEAERGDAMNG